MKTKPTADEIAKHRSSIGVVLWVFAEMTADAVRVACPPTENADEARRKAFNAARAAGWDRFERLCAYLEHLECRVAELEMNR